MGNKKVEPKKTKEKQKPMVPEYDDVCYGVDGKPVKPTFRILTGK